MRLVCKLLLALTLTSLLAGCALGGSKPRKRIHPPRASVQELMVDANGQWQLTLRLQNFSNVPTTFDSVDAKLTVEGQEAGSIALSAALTVGPESADVLSTQLSPTSAAKISVASALASGQPVRYRLSGKIGSSEPSGKHAFDFESVLTPAPGLNGVLR
jgi:hypothetical protein